MFSIRDATYTDIPLIRDLTFRIWPQTYKDIISAEQIDYMLDMMYSESSIAKQMDEGCKFLFVYDDQEPVGFACYQQISDNGWKLHKIYVLGSQQGKGTGRFVIDHVINECKGNGGRTLELQVNRNNKAKGFYEKLGFIEREVINLDIGHGYYMNDYVMEKKW